MTEQEIRAQAVVNELASQRMILGDRAATLAADLAVAKARIAELEKQLAQ